MVEIGLITLSTYTHPLITKATKKHCTIIPGIKKDKKNAQNYQKLKFGLWNVRGCSQESKLQEIAEQIAERKYHIAVITETRMTSKIIDMDNSGLSFYNSNPDINDYRNTGVGFLVNDQSMITATDFEEVDGRIATIKIHSKAAKQTIYLIGCYAPTESSNDEVSK